MSIDEALRARYDLLLQADNIIKAELKSDKTFFKGLDKDTYILHEVEAPQGYNIAPDQTVPEATLVIINGTIKMN